MSRSVGTGEPDARHIALARERKGLAFTHSCSLVLHVVTHLSYSTVELRGGAVTASTHTPFA